jgi:hypothetical protein
MTPRRRSCRSQCARSIFVSLLQRTYKATWHRMRTGEIVVVLVSAAEEGDVVRPSTVRQLRCSISELPTGNCPTDIVFGTSDSRQAATISSDRLDRAAELSPLVDAPRSATRIAHVHFDLTERRLALGLVRQVAASTRVRHRENGENFQSKSAFHHSRTFLTCQFCVVIECSQVNTCNKYWSETRQRGFL